MKKTLLIILFSIYTLAAQENNIDNHIIKLGILKYTSLSSNLKTGYLGYERQRRKDIFTLEYTHLDLQNKKIKKDGKMFKLSYIFKLAYENNIEFGPKFSYIKYNFDSYNDDFINLGLYGLYDIDNKYKIYANYIIDNSIKKSGNKELNNINFGIKYNNNKFVYDLNIQTSASINIHNKYIVELFSANEYEKILFSIGYKY